MMLLRYKNRTIFYTYIHYSVMMILICFLSSIIYTNKNTAVYLPYMNNFLLLKPLHWLYKEPPTFWFVLNERVIRWYFTRIFWRDFTPEVYTVVKTLICSDKHEDFKRNFLTKWDKKISDSYIKSHQFVIYGPACVRQSNHYHYWCLKLNREIPPSSFLIHMHRVINNDERTGTCKKLFWLTNKAAIIVINQVVLW